MIMLHEFSHRALKGAFAKQYQLGEAFFLYGTDPQLVESCERRLSRY